MKRLFFSSFVVLACIILIFTYIPDEKAYGISSMNYPRISVQKSDNILSTYIKRDISFGKVPLYFIPNKGQVDAKVRFYARTSTYTMWILKEGLLFHSVVNGKNKGKLDISWLNFLHSNSNLRITPVNISQHNFNAIKGKDRSKWVQGIHTSRAVLYKDIYKNIDLKIYGTETQVEYDWIVKPGGNPAVIKFQYVNAKRTYIDNEGNLVIETGYLRILHKMPVSYQLFKGRKIPILSKFKETGKNTYTFIVKKYNPNYELVIDPVISLTYSTFLGGSEVDKGDGLALDKTGNIYISGTTGSCDFPTVNAYQGINKGFGDAFLVKLNPEGSEILFSTFIGGNYADEGWGVAVSANGNVYLSGITHCIDFPSQNTTIGFPDAFVARFDTDGNFKGAYLVGGSGWEDCGKGITVDNFGNPVVVGTTWSTDFPYVNPYQTLVNSSSCFICKLKSDLSRIIYSTTLGGNGSSGAGDIVIDKAGYYYVTGFSAGSGFPVKNAYQVTPGGNYDAIVTKLTPDGSDLVFSSYLGSSYEEKANSIGVDNSGAVYIGGYIINPKPKESKSSLNLTNGFIELIRGNMDCFTAKFSPGGSELVYFKQFGGDDWEWCESIVVTGNGYSYIIGTTYSSNFPLKNPHQFISRAFEVFICAIKPDGSDFLFSTLLGGGALDRGHCIVRDYSGNIYVRGDTESVDFPTVNPIQAYHKGACCDLFLSKFSVSNVLTAQSMPIPGAKIKVAPVDIDGNRDGITNFTRIYNHGTMVTLQAPEQFKKMIFQKWIIDGIENPNQKIQLNLTGNKKVSAVYYDRKILRVNPWYLEFRYQKLTGRGSVSELSKTLYIDKMAGESPIRWALSTGASWLRCNPGSGADSGNVTVSVNPAGLARGQYRATLSIKAPGTIFDLGPYTGNSPGCIAVSLLVY